MDSFGKCLSDTMLALHQTLAELRPTIAKKHNLVESEVENVYRLGLIGIAVEKCTAIAPNMTSAETEQLTLHVNHLIAGAVSSAVDRLRDSHKSDGTSDE